MEKSSEAVTECVGCVRYAYTLTGDDSERGMRIRRTNEIQGSEEEEEEVTGLTDETVKDTAVYTGGGGGLP